MARNPSITDIGTSTQGTDLVPIVPNNAEDLPLVARAIRCRPDGAGGTLRFVAYSGELRNTYISPGETLRVIAKRVHATGTTATLLEAYL